MFTKKVIFAPEKKASWLYCWDDSENELPESFDRNEEEGEDAGMMASFRLAVPPP